jgi:hypothetical protein
LSDQIDDKIGGLLGRGRALSVQQKQLLGNRNQDSIGYVAGDDGQDYAFDASP